MTTHDKSKKRKDHIINKAELWNIFESEVVNENNGGCEDLTFKFFDSIFGNKKDIISSNNNYKYDDFDYIVIYFFKNR